MVRLFEKASDYGVRLLLPCDFHVATKPAFNIKTPANQPSSNVVTGHTGENSAPKDDEKKVTSAMEDTHGTHNSVLNSVDEFVASNPEQHWSDVVYSMNKVQTIDLEEKIQACLAQLQSAHLLKRATPNVMSNPSLMRPGSTQFESHHYSEEDQTRKSLVSRVGSSQAEKPPTSQDIIPAPR